MADEPLHERYETALSSLKRRASQVDLAGFEQAVWSEIALREERGWRRLLVWWREVRFPFPVGATCEIAAMAAGAFLGISQADVYDRESALALEQRYVESIHPVLRSAHHHHQDLGSETSRETK